MDLKVGPGSAQPDAVVAQLTIFRRGDTMNQRFPIKEHYGFDDLVAIMKILRGEGGCPWDREQTHASLRKNLIEETYEAVEAIDQDDPAMMTEELGDVLLQVVFHAEIERQDGRFDIGSVTDGICKKLIERHPHIFGDVQASTSDEVLKNWDEIKKREKHHETHAQTLEAVPRTLPALMRSCKVQQRAAKSGFDWPTIYGALQKLHEETGELEEALEARAQNNASSETDGACTEELGDLLFSAVNVARFLKTDPEEALTFACDKFIRRFTAVENAAHVQGRELSSLSMQEMDKLWEQVKQHSTPDVL